MPTWYYRFVSNPAEVKQIVDERKIQSLNSHTNYLTWYTPTRYGNVNQAQQELAMPYPQRTVWGQLLIPMWEHYRFLSGSLLQTLDSLEAGLRQPLMR
jgi:hypothetical protein